MKHVKVLDGTFGNWGNYGGQSCSALHALVGLVSIVGGISNKYFSVLGGNSQAAGSTDMMWAWSWMLVEQS